VKTETVGQTVKAARKRAGMTQQDLAQATGMPQPSISRIEAGTVIPRAATLIALLEATGHQLVVVPIDSAVDREADF
jgi:transcriptional regulator with XRE-family HTH domain